MFGFNEGSYYDALCNAYGEVEAFARYEKQTGKLIVATVQKSGDTRLFMRSINPITDMRNKNGWWNTFTISKKPCDAGTYICKIDEVRSDKDGYPIFVVHPVVHVDENIICSNELTYVFGLSNMFTEDFGRWDGSYNNANLEEQVRAISFIPETGDINGRIAAFQEAVRLFVNGTICEDQIAAWLKEPTDWQKEMASFEEEVVRFFKQDLNAMVIAKDIPALAEPNFFPLTAKKCLKFLSDRSYVWTDAKVEFVRELICKYESAVNAGHIAAVEGKSMWHKIEAYLAFDEARKQANKAAKTAAKKAKKNAAKADN